MPAGDACYKPFSTVSQGTPFSPMNMSFIASSMEKFPGFVPFSLQLNSLADLHLSTKYSTRPLCPFYPRTSSKLPLTTLSILMPHQPTLPYPTPPLHTRFATLINVSLTRRLSRSSLQVTSVAQWRNSLESYINAGLVRSQSDCIPVLIGPTRLCAGPFRLGCGTQWIQLERIGRIGICSRKDRASCRRYIHLHHQTGKTPSLYVLRILLTQRNCSSRNSSKTGQSPYTNTPNLLRSSRSSFRTATRSMSSLK